MFKIKNCQSVPVTEKLAKFFQEMRPLERDRTLKPGRCELLGNKINAGKAIPFNWAYIEVKDIGQIPIRLNGAHSTEVILSKEVSLEGLWAYITCFEGDTMQDAAEAWAQYDAMFNARTASEVYASIGSTLPNLSDDISIKIRKLCAIGFDFDLNDGRPGSKTIPEDRMINIASQYKKVRFVNDILLNPLDPEKGVKFLERGPVIAGLSRTFDKCNSSAQAFWSAVRDTTNSDPHSPDRRLSERLKQYAVSSGGGRSNPQKKGIAPEVMFLWCIQAWNAYREKDFKFEFDYSNIIPKAV